LYMEPRESGSYSVPSFLSTHRKNLAIILSRSVEVSVLGLFPHQ
jgi:hypothetical protein